MPDELDVVDDAADKLEKPEGEAEGENKDETPEDTETVVDDKEGKDDDDPEFDELSAKEAKILYKALKNPATRDQVLNELVQGFGHKPAETKTEVKAVKRDIVGKLKEHLADFGFLADKLGPAIEAILAEERQENAAQISRLEQVNLSNEVNSVIGQIRSSHRGEDWPRVEARMVSLMDEITAGPKTTTEKYLRNIYNLAIAGKAKVSATTEITDKIRKNSNDVGGRLQSSARGADSKVKFDPKKSYSVSEAVSIAQKQLEESRK